MARSGIWKGSISFGLLNIPVAMQTANQEKELHFSMLDGKDFSPIRFKRVNANTGKEVPYDKIVKGFEFKDGEYVVMTDADFKAANPKASQTIDIEDFILLEDIDFMMFEKPYYLVPQKGGEKGYFLLRDALEAKKKVAVGKMVMRTKQHLVAVMVRGDYLVLEMLRFAHEVLAADEVDYLDDAKKVKYSPRELKMAEELIDDMTSKWEPDKYNDTYYDDLMKRIRAKVKAGKGHVITEPDEVPDVEETTTDNVVDLLPLLRQSLGHRGSKPAKHRTAAKAKGHRHAATH